MIRRVPLIALPVRSMSSWVPCLQAKLRLFFVVSNLKAPMAADNDGKTIVIAGLDGDYLRRSFGQVLDIIPLADTITKLTARCELCGKRAFFTLRKTDETQTELIGGADVYMPVCRQHYANGQAAMEAARGVLESHHKVQSDHTLEAAAAI